MSHSATKHCQINGKVAPGFEPIEQLYEHHMRTMSEQNTRLCVYYRGEKVVDLWASAMDDNNFSADSLVNVFSSGKSLEAIAVASLVSKGLLTTRFTQGGVDSFTTCEAGSTGSERAFNEGREGFYGWLGLGGPIFPWHPRLDIGFAFVPTSLLMPGNRAPSWLTTLGHAKDSLWSQAAMTS